MSLVTKDVCGFFIEWDSHAPGGATCRNHYQKPCPLCGDINCSIHCVMSKGKWTEEEIEASRDNHAFNLAIDSIESLLIAMTCEGIDVEQPGMENAVQSALDAISNNLT